MEAGEEKGKLWGIDYASTMPVSTYTIIMTNRQSPVKWVEIGTLQKNLTDLKKVRHSAVQWKMSVKPVHELRDVRMSWPGHKINTVATADNSP